MLPVKQTKPVRSEQQLVSNCYFYNQQNSPCVLPIMSNSYKVIIRQNVCLIQSVQQYSNPYSTPLQIHYKLPLDQLFALSYLTAEYKDITVQGVIKERNQVKYQYKQSIDKGQTAVSARISKKQSSILNIKLGMIMKQQKIRIRFGLIGQLKRELQGTLTLRIPSHIGPRYNKQTTKGNNEFYIPYKKAYTQWDFSIQIHSSQTISSFNCTSHKLKVSKFSKNQLNIQMDLQKQQKSPKKDLQLSYTRQNPFKPFCTIGKKCAVLTYHTPKPIKSIFQTYQGQYIFLLDRSGSMDGERMQKANQALILFLMSLPQNSSFNIISFGSDYQKLYSQCQKYQDKIVQQTIKKVKLFDASFGGTQLQQVMLKIALEAKNKKTAQNFNRNIIILTDGQVQNPSKTIQIIKNMKQTNIAKTHIVGIGNGVSYEMIQNGAIQGGGQYMFVMDEQQMKKQVMFLLKKMMVPSLKQVQLLYNTEIFEKDQPLIPKTIKKDSEISFYLKFNAQYNISDLTNQTIGIKYFDEQLNKTSYINITLRPEYWIQNLYKFLVHKQIQNLIISRQQAKAIQLSIKEQVLCKYTGYYCKIKQNPNKKVENSYLLKLKNSLEGQSILKRLNFKIFVKTLSGKTITIEAFSDSTVADVQQTIKQAQGIPVDQQKLIFAGAQLQGYRRLNQYNIQNQSTINLVLRLRAGGQYKPSIIVKIKGYKPFDLSSLGQLTKISQVYQKIFKENQQLRNLKFNLVNKGKILDKDRTLKDYRIGRGNELIEDDLPDYMGQSQGIIKYMKVAGYWQYNQQMLKNLNLLDKFQQYQQQNKKQSKDKVMTRCIKYHLERKYKDQQQQLQFIYKKIDNYLGR